MMPLTAKLKIDQADAARVKESKGIVTEVTRLATLYDISESGPNIGGIQRLGTNDKVLEAALDPDLAITNVTGWLPRPGEPHPSFPNVIVSERQAKPRGSGIVEVNITYADPTGGSLPPGQNFAVTGRGALQQITTARRGPEITDAFIRLEDDSGNVQGGEITPYLPLSELTLERTEILADPVGIARNATGFVNAGSWFADQSADARTWIVTGVEFELTTAGIGGSFNQYRMRYNFAWDGSGWDPEAIFIDPATDKPSDNITNGLGTTLVQWYPMTDFDLLLGSG